MRVDDVEVGKRYKFETEGGLGHLFIEATISDIDDDWILFGKDYIIYGDPLKCELMEKRIEQCKRIPPVIVKRGIISVVEVDNCGEK